MQFAIGMDSSCASYVGFWSLNSLLPEGLDVWGGIYNFKAKFKCAILKIKTKMSLLQFFGHISLIRLYNGPIAKMLKLAYIFALWEPKG